MFNAQNKSKREAAKKPSSPAAQSTEPALTHTGERISFQLFTQPPAADAPSEREADAAAASVVQDQSGGAGAAGAGVPPSLPPGVPPSSPSVPASPFGVIIEDGSQLGPGQMYRTQFIETMSAEIERAADEELAATGRTARDCPYLNHWLRFYRERSAAHIERVIQHYARPERIDLISLREAVVARVRDAVRAWVRSDGREVQTPEGVAWLGQNDGLSPSSGTGAGTGTAIQRKPIDGPGGAPSVSNPAAARAQLQNGHSLDSAARARMERGFGRSFGDVRLHTDSHAAQMASSFSARAFTIGDDVAFGAGQYRPGTLAGDLLIAHELAHVVQQRAAPTGVGVSTHAETAATEKDASRVALGLLGRREIVAGHLSHKDVTAHAARHGIAASEAEEALADPCPRLIAPLGLHRCGDSSSTSAPTSATPATTSVTPSAPSGPTLSLPAAGTEPEQALGLSELQAELALVASGLDRLVANRAADTSLNNSVVGARAELRSLNTTLVGGVDDTRRVRTALAIVERLEHVFPLIEAQEQALAGRSGYLQAVTAVRSAYIRSIDRLFASDARATFDAAEQAAQRLPRALVNVDLDRIEQHATRNRRVLITSENLWQYVQTMRTRLATFDAMTNTPSAPATTLVREAELLQLGLEGMEHYDRVLQANEFIVRNRPGLLDSPTTGALGRLREQVEAIRMAFSASDLENLRIRVTRLRNDQNVVAFYRALPGMMGVTTLITRIGISYVAAAVTGGVGGLVMGGTRAAATGLTTRAALSFVGTVALETLTFTAVSTGLNAVFMGDRPTFGSVLRDLAWNAGLFIVLRAAGAGAARGLRAAELEMLSGPVHLVTPFPILQGYGVLRFRIERGRWPTRAELDQMTAENIITMAALAVGLRVVQRWTAGRSSSALRRFREAYGVGFEGLEAVRQRLQSEIIGLEQRGAPDAEVEAARTRLANLEGEYQALLRRVMADRRFNLDELRAELDAAREVAPESSAEALARVLNLPPEVGLRRAGARSHTYASGATNALEAGLRASGATVTKTQDPTTGLRTVEARFGSEPPITFRERAAGEIAIDPGGLDVQLFFTELSVTRAEAQRMLLRLMSEHLTREPTRNLEWAIRQTRRQVRELLSRPGAPASAQDLLLSLRTGRQRATATARLVSQLDALEAAGILRSAEWLDCRSDAQREGVVTEWLAGRQVRAPHGGRLIRRVRFIGDAFTDAAGTTPYVRRSGQRLTNTDIAELDFVAVVDNAGALEVHTVANVKAGRSEAPAAAFQNRNALSLIRGSATGLPSVVIDGNAAFARITRVTAIDGGVEVDVTGRLREAPGGAAEQTIGPQGGRGYSHTVPFGRTDIRTLAQLLFERQLVNAGDY